MRAAKKIIANTTVIRPCGIGIILVLVHLFIAKIVFGLNLFKSTQKFCG